MDDTVKETLDSGLGRRIDAAAHAAVVRPEVAAVLKEALATKPGDRLLTKGDLTALAKRLIAAQAGA